MNTYAATYRNDGSVYVIFFINDGFEANQHSMTFDNRAEWEKYKTDNDLE